MRKQINVILDSYKSQFEEMDKKELQSYVMDINIEKGGLLANETVENALGFCFKEKNNQYQKVTKLASDYLKKIDKENLLKILINDEENRLINQEPRETLDEFYLCQAY